MTNTGPVSEFSHETRQTQIKKKRKRDSKVQKMFRTKKYPENHCVSIGIMEVIRISKLLHDS